MREEQLIDVSLEQSVLHYAQLRKRRGLDGVVCSVHEAAAITEVCGNEFFKVTPGIRLADGGAHDQKRIATPEEARLAGSTHIVVGRAITGATDPRAAYEMIMHNGKDRNDDEKKEIAQILLNVGAVELNPNEPFIWASGIESPIYCDNRLTMSDPIGRKKIAEGLARINSRKISGYDSHCGNSNSWYSTRCMGCGYFRSSDGVHSINCKRARTKSSNRRENISWR